MDRGKLLKELREAKQLSQTDAARHLGVSKQTLYKYENNIITNIPSNIIERMATLYETTPARLMGWEEQVKKLSVLGKQLSKTLSYEVDLTNGMKVELEKVIECYEPSEVLRAMKFLEAFLKANPERQQIATEILQSHQEDS